MGTERTGEFGRNAESPRVERQIFQDFKTFLAWARENIGAVVMDMRLPDALSSGFGVLTPEDLEAAEKAGYTFQSLSGPYDKYPKT